MLSVVRRFSGLIIASLIGLGFQLSGIEDMRFAIAFWAIAVVWGLIALFTWEPVFQVLRNIKRIRIVIADSNDATPKREDIEEPGEKGLLDHRVAVLKALPRMNEIFNKYIKDLESLNKKVQSHTIKIKKTTYEAERYVSMLTIPIVVLVIVFSSEIINIILNQSFEPAINTLRILSIFVLLTVLYMPFNYIVVGMDRPGLSAKVATIGCVINIVMNYLLIPSDGLLSKYDIVGPNGAAIATVLSAFTMLILYRVISKRMIKSRLFQPCVIIHILAGVAMGFFLYFISTFTDTIMWYHLIIFAISGLGIYTFILWSLKEFDKDDYQMIINAIDPKGMFLYIKSELRGKRTKE